MNESKKETILIEAKTKEIMDEVEDFVYGLIGMVYTLPKTSRI